MTDAVDPTRRVNGDRRRGPRRASDAPAALDAPLPVIASPASAPKPEPLPTSAFAAQLLGQPGQKRGLRAGAEALDKARAAYLEAEWSGPQDRRIPTGKVSDADI